jgi:hypothetical protein
MNTSNPEEDWASKTIIEVPFESPHNLRSLCLEQPDAPEIHDLAVDRKLFKIRLASTGGRRSSASMLIRKMYAWRGYETSLARDENPNRLTLMASHEENVIGTITLGFDSSIGLLVDDLYKEKTDPLRQQGRRLCEFTKLAVDSGVRSKRVLASLFHIAYIFAHNIRKATDLLVEVNPRHVRFYEKMLGFERLGEEKLNRRVNAPAVLLWLDLDHARRQIEQFGGRGSQARGEKSLYPYFFAPDVEEGITNRLRKLE